MASGKSAGSIFVDLLLGTSGYDEGLRRSSNNTKRWASQQQNSLKGVSASTQAIGAALSRLGGIAAGAFSIQKVVQYSDTFKQLEGRLSLVTNSTEELNAVQERLFQIAQATRSDFEATVTLYQRLTSATKGLGISQEEVFKFTEQLNKQLLVAGVSSQEAAAAIFQLTQAFNKGKLDGDEFRTILEAAPPILEALEVSLGKTRGEILKLAQDGKLTPKVLVDAVNQMSTVTDERFSKLSLTMEQAFKKLNNSILDFIGDSELINSATTGVAEGIEWIAEAITDLKDPTDDIKQGFYTLTAGILGAYRALTQLGISNAEKFNIFGVMDGRIENLKARLEDINTAIDEAAAAALEAERRGDALARTGGKDEEKTNKGTDSPADPKAFEKLNKQLDALAKQNRKYITGMNDDMLRYYDTVEELDTLLKNHRITQEEYNQAVARAGDELDKATDKANDWAFDVEAASKRAAENIQDNLADFLFDPFDQGLKGMLKGFVDILRRMAAEAAAAQILEGIFGGTGGLGKVLGGVLGQPDKNGIKWDQPFSYGDFGGIFDGFFADGGFIQPGHFGVAGEEGAELLYGGRQGVTVTPQDKMGGGNTYYIDATGADMKTVMRLEKALLTLAGPGVIERRVKEAQVRGAI